MKKYIIILGPPGSGKGTQAKNIAEKYGYYFFGTGDLMRDEAKKETSLGLEFKKVWDQKRGGLVSEELVQRFVREKLESLGIDQKIIFDGYPRSVLQAEHLNNILKSREILILNLVVAENELIERMSTRRICEKCEKIFEKPIEKGIKVCDNCVGELILRQEDQPEVIHKRLEVYNQATAPVVNYYKKNAQVENIDGNPPIDVVWQSIQKEVEND